jgi:hypothetical protein
MSAILPENRRACILKIRDAFSDCPRPAPEQLSPAGGIDAPHVHLNWGHLTREEVEAFDEFGSYHAEDITYMSSIAFRYFVPSVMILFLNHPSRVDFGGFVSLVSRCESAFLTGSDDPAHGQVAMTRPQADAFRDWFGQLMIIIRKFHLGSFEAGYVKRLRTLRSRLKNFTPDKDHDEALIQSVRQRRYPKGLSG